jgi:hypothetical protein
MKSKSRGTTAPPKSLSDRVAAALRRHGVGRVAGALDIGPEAVLRLALGLRTHRGTIVMAERGLPELE